MTLKKKIIFAAAAFSLTLSSCSVKNTRVADEGANKLYTYNLNMYKLYDSEYAEGDNTEFNKMLRERFGIKFNYDRIPKSDWKARVSTYFTSGETPDIIIGGDEDIYKIWAEDGYLAPIDYTALNEWCGLWGDDLQKVVNLASDTDGEMYYLPSVNQDKVKLCWLYRKDVFDDLGTEFPSSADEFLAVCEKLKEKYPNKTIISSDGDRNNVLAGFFQAFWIPADVLVKNSCVDPKTGEFIPYAMAEDNAREMLKFVNILYREGYFDYESLSAEGNFTDRAEDSGFITYDYVYNGDKLSGQSGGEWTWADNMLTYDENRGTIFKKEPLYNKFGVAFGADLGDDEEKFKTILRYYDWCASKEGRLYTTYGIEGKSYEIKNGQPEVKAGWYHEKENPSGKKISEEFGIIPYTFIQHLKMHKEIIKDEPETLYKAYTSKSDYYSFEEIPMRYTKEEKERYTELETALGIKRDEYINRFIKGEDNPGDDSAWNRYLEELNKAGLEEFNKLQKTVYERTAAELG